MEGLGEARMGLGEARKGLGKAWRPKEPKSTFVLFRVFPKCYACFIEYFIVTY